MELPESGSQVEGEGGQGAGRVGAEDTRKIQAFLRVSLYAGRPSGGKNGHVPSPPGPSCSREHTRGASFRELCSPASTWCLGLRYGWLMSSSRRQKGPGKAPVPRPLPPFANEETETQRGKATSQGHTVKWQCRGRGSSYFRGIFSLSPHFFLCVPTLPPILKAHSGDLPSSSSSSCPTPPPRATPSSASSVHT